LPAVEEFSPQILLISAGFDAWKSDPVGGLQISREAFFECGRWLADLASRVTEGRLMLTLEGGYDLSALPSLVLAHLAGLAGSPLPSERP